MGVSQNQGYHFRGPHNKDYSILGSILGLPYFGKLPYIEVRKVTMKIIGVLQGLMWGRMCAGVKTIHVPRSSKPTINPHDILEKIVYIPIPPTKAFHAVRGQDLGFGCR